MLKNEPKKLGQQGEQKAAEYLQAKGFTILVQNYRWARGEIDLIAKDGSSLVFIEVKTSYGLSRLGSPETWVRLTKQRQIGKTAQRYLQVEEVAGEPDCRFDVIGVTYAHGSWYFKHVEDAFWL